MKGERISMKKFKIKTNLVSGIIMGVIALILILVMPSQVRVPAYDSGAPSPRIIPGICLAIMQVSSIALIIQSLILKQEKVVEFDWAKEKPAILLILGMCVYIVVLVAAFAIFLLFKNVFNISLPALGLLGGII